MDNDELFDYGSFTIEKLEEITNEIYKERVQKDRNFKLHVYFNNQKEADSWMKMFNDLCQEELIKQLKKLKNE